MSLYYDVPWFCRFGWSRSCILESEGMYIIFWEMDGMIFCDYLVHRLLLAFTSVQMGWASPITDCYLLFQAFAF